MTEPNPLPTRQQIDRWEGIEAAAASLLAADEAGEPWPPNAAAKLRALLVSTPRPEPDPNVLRVSITVHEDESAVIDALRLPEANRSYLRPELVSAVAAAIREYPNWDAPQWLAPVAAIRRVEDWLVGNDALDRVSTPQPEPATTDAARKGLAAQLRFTARILRSEGAKQRASRIDEAAALLDAEASDPEWCPNAPADDPGHCAHWYDCEPCHRCGSDDGGEDECDCPRHTAVRAAAAELPPDHKRQEKNTMSHDLRIGATVICITDPGTRGAREYPAIVSAILPDDRLDLCIFTPDPGGLRSVPRLRLGEVYDRPSSTQRAAAWELPPEPEGDPDRNEAPQQAA